MRAFVEICRSGVDGLALHPLRAAVTVFAVFTPLVPFLLGICISRGVAREAESALAEGGDLHVSGSAFGRPGPLPAACAPIIARLDGVVSVTPRIVGPLSLGTAAEEAVLVGVPPGRWPEVHPWLQGRLPRSAALNELVVGAELARRLRLKLGDTLPPFYRNRSGERLSVVVGVLNAEAPIWSSRVIITDLKTAGSLFNQPGKITDVQVRCRPGAEESAASAILEQGEARSWGTLRVTTRGQLMGLLEQSASHREGLFHLGILLALIVSIGVVMVTSGAGIAERAREFGLLKATGWGTEEILLRSFCESICIGALAFSLAVIVALVWLRFLNGWGVGPIFVSGLEPASRVRIPYEFAPAAAAVAGIASATVVLTGGLYSAWRAAICSPLEALRR